VGIPFLCVWRVDRVGLVAAGVDLVRSSTPLLRNNSAALPLPCRCWRCWYVGGVVFLLIYGSSCSSAPFPVGGSGGSKGDFAPRRSEGLASSALLWLVGAATATALPCEYWPLLPLCRCAGELPIGGAGAGSRCAGCWWILRCWIHFGAACSCPSEDLVLVVFFLSGLVQQEVCSRGLGSAEGGCRCRRRRSFIGQRSHLASGGSCGFKLLSQINEVAP
jgi:hypothetical protein